MLIEDEQFTLCLNSQWLAVHYKKIRDSIVSLFESDNLVLDIQYRKDPVQINGVWDYPTDDIAAIVPLTWDAWIKLKIRPFDKWINTSRLQIRVPTIIIAANFNKVIMKRMQMTKTNIYARDGGKCQYSGENISKHRATIDHVIPRNRGGKNTWTNVVLCRDDINHKKGDKTNLEAGLKLLRQPTEPKSMPLSSFVGEILHPDHLPFLIK